MMKGSFHKLSVYTVLLLYSVGVFGQGVTQARFRVVQPTITVLKMDTLPLLPFSVKIQCNAENIAPQRYNIDYSAAVLTLDSTLLNCRLHITYRVFLPDLGLTLWHKQHTEVLSADTLLRTQFLSGTSTHSNIIAPSLKTSSLDYSGNFTRGFTVGQDGSTALNSALNLQLSGDLQENIRLTASISDQNLPLSPQGNTASINEFDRIFMRIDAPYWYVEGGDIIAQSKKGFFSMYSRKILGIGGGAKFTSGNYKVDVNVGVSKGKFSRNQIAPIENNLGPYRLSGESGQIYIVILSGTDRVFIDGVQLQRGNDKDYTIDYQTAEISFMPQIQISRFSRIVVEFEYVERSYGRYTVATNNLFRLGERVEIFANILMENDIVSQPIDQNLTDQNRHFLSTIGNQTWLATIPTAQKVLYDNRELLYTQIDTIVGEKSYTIYKYYSSNADNVEQNLYKVGFTMVGKGAGNYRMAQSSANGQTYQWIAPVNNLPQGEYEPVKTIAPPTVKQLYTTGIKFQMDSLSVATAEMALSNHNRNTLSQINNDENIGFAGIINSNKNFNITSSQRIVSKTHILLHSYNFTAPERYLPVEFFRTWSIPILVNQSLQHYSQEFTYGLSKFVDFKFGGAYLVVSDTKGTVLENTKLPRTEGYKYWLLGQINLNLAKINVEFNNAITSSQIKRGFYQRAEMAINFDGFRFFNHKISANHEAQAAHRLDTLQNDSRTVWKVSYSIKNKDNSAVETQLSTSASGDKVVFNHQLIPYSHSFDISYSTRVNKEWFNIDVLSRYRYLDVKKEFAENKIFPHQLGGRILTNFYLLKRSLALSTSYEVSNVTTPQFSYTYIEVGPGRGIYTWIDYNGNNIKELEEFEVAKFEDQATYIRVQLPTNRYRISFVSSGTLSVNFMPIMLFTKPTGFKKVLTSFSLSSSITGTTKTTNSSYNPFAVKSIEDTTLLEQQIYLINTLTFTTPSRKINAVLGHRINLSKNQLVNGFEGVRTKTYTLALRYAPISILHLFTELEIGEKGNFSQYFKQRNYEVNSFKVNNGLEVSITPWSKNRLNYGYQYRTATPYSADIHTITNLYTVYITPNSSIPVELSYVRNRYDGELNSVLGYQMSDGLGIGNNYLWKLAYRQLFSSGVEINLQYSGRKLPKFSTQHSGTVEIRVHF